MVINTVSSYLETLQNSLFTGKMENSTIIDSRGLPARFFFRGQPADYNETNNVASIFRDGKRKNEYAYTNEYMRRYTEQFNQLENNFSRLTYMQHYGLPTRLLDVTTNALVALYFACQPHDNDDGLVSVFSSNRSRNDNAAYSYFSSHSDTVEILSTLALMNEEIKEKIFRKITDFNKAINSINNAIHDEVKQSYQDNTEIDYFNVWYNDQIKKEKSEDILNNIELKAYNKRKFKYNEKYDSLNDSYEIKCLYHDIRRDVNYFDNIINFHQLLLPFFVEPSLNNERLRAQSGFFLFEPYAAKSCVPKNIHDNIKKNISLLDKKGYEITLTIPNDNKEAILKELDIYCDINRATLFPDKENVSSYISQTFLKD